MLKVTVNIDKITADFDGKNIHFSQYLDHKTLSENLDFFYENLFKKIEKKPIHIFSKIPVVFPQFFLPKNYSLLSCFRDEIIAEFSPKKTATTSGEREDFEPIILREKWGKILEVFSDKNSMDFFKKSDEKNQEKHQKVLEKTQKNHKEKGKFLSKKEPKIFEKNSEKNSEEISEKNSEEISEKNSKTSQKKPCTKCDNLMEKSCFRNGRNDCRKCENIRRAKHKKNYPEMDRVNSQNRRTAKKNIPFKISEKITQELFSFYGNMCVCCGNENSLTVDHIIPISHGAKKGASNHPINLQPLCDRCNGKKATKAIDYRHDFGVDFLKNLYIKGLLKNTL